MIARSKINPYFLKSDFELVLRFSSGSHVCIYVLRTFKWERKPCPVAEQKNVSGANLSFRWLGWSCFSITISSLSLIDVIKGWLQNK
jgi:hypothetical protein